MLIKKGLIAPGKLDLSVWAGPVDGDDDLLPQSNVPDALSCAYHSLFLVISFETPQPSVLSAWLRAKAAPSTPAAETGPLGCGDGPRAGEMLRDRISWRRRSLVPYSLSSLRPSTRRAMNSEASITRGLPLCSPLSHHVMLPFGQVRRADSCMPT